MFACRDCLFILPAGAGARAVGTLPPLSTGIWAHVILTMIFTQILSIVDKNFAKFFKILILANAVFHSNVFTYK